MITAFQMVSAKNAIDISFVTPSHQPTTRNQPPFHSKSATSLCRNDAKLWFTMCNLRWGSETQIDHEMGQQEDRPPTPSSTRPSTSGRISSDSSAEAALEPQESTLLFSWASHPQLDPMRWPRWPPATPHGHLHPRGPMPPPLFYFI
jgi:hypothetical protein